MKMLLASVLAFSFSAFATPKVGDVANYNILYQGFTFSQDKEIVAYDATSDLFTIKEVTTYSGRQETEMSTEKGEDMMSTESINMILALCQSPEVGGKSEVITVPAGTFAVCTLAAPEGVLSFGQVPFGVVKAVTPMFSMELTGYKAN